MTPRPSHLRAVRAFTLLELLIAIGVVILLAALTISATVALGRRSDVRETESTLRLLDLAVTAWQEEASQAITWGVDDLPSEATYDMLNGSPHLFTVTEILERIGKSPAALEIIRQIDPKFVHEYDVDEEQPLWIRVAADGTDAVDGDPDPGAAIAADWFADQILWKGATKERPLGGRIAILDAWGLPIRAVHPGRVASHAFGDFAPPGPWDPDVPGDIDDDGTIFIDGRADAFMNVMYGTEAIYGRAAGRRILFVSGGPDRLFGDASAEHDEPEHEPVEDNVYSYGRHEH